MTRAGHVLAGTSTFAEACRQRATIGVDIEHPFYVVLGRQRQLVAERLLKADQEPQLTVLDTGIHTVAVFARIVEPKLRAQHTGREAPLCSWVLRFPGAFPVQPTAQDTGAAKKMPIIPNISNTSSHPTIHTASARPVLE